MYLKMKQGVHTGEHSLKKMKDVSQFYIRAFKDL